MNGLARHLRASSFPSLIRNYGGIKSICRFSSQSDGFSGTGGRVPFPPGDSEPNSGLPNTGRNSSPSDSNASTFSDIKSGLSNNMGRNFSPLNPNAQNFKIVNFGDSFSIRPTFNSFREMNPGSSNRGGNSFSGFNAPPSTFRNDRRGTDLFSQINPSLSNTGGSGLQAPRQAMEFVKSVVEEGNAGQRSSSLLSHFQRPKLDTNADIVHIKMLRNNTFVTITDSKGNVKCKATAGSVPDLKGGKKMSNYTADATAENIGRKARAMGINSVVVKVNGFTHFNKKRKAIVAFRDGFTNSRSDRNPIVYIEDSTRRAHNGCRLRKKRRI